MKQLTIIGSAFVVLFIHFSGSASSKDSGFHQRRNCSQTASKGNRLEIDCTGVGLNTVPSWLPARTYRLDMSNNPLKSVPNGAFKHLRHLKYLILAKCQIDHLDRNSFFGLSYLSFLDLSSNFLQTKTISKFAFRYLVNLKALKIDRNRFYLDNAYPGIALSVLNSLSYLSIEAINECVLGEGFGNLSSLTTLNLFSDREDSMNLVNDTVSLLCAQSLKYIRIQINNGYLNFIDTGIFINCTYLTGIYISAVHNSNITMILKTLYGLQGQDMDYLSFPDCNLGFRHKPTSLQQEDVKYLKRICFKSLNIQNNFIKTDSHFAQALLSLEHKNCLEEINISLNIFVYEYHPYAILLCDKNFTNIKRVNMYQMRTQNYKIEKSYNETFLPAMFNVTFSNSTMVNDSNYSFETHGSQMMRVNISFSPNIEFINASLMKTTGVEIPILTIHADKLTTLDFADAKFDSCAGEIRGMSHLKHLNMSRWECRDLNPKLIQNLTSLITLDASSSQLSTGLSRSDADMFLRGLTNLSSIKLSNNALEDLHYGFFSDQYKSLREVYLDNNKFQNIPFDLTQFIHLNTIDLRRNVISACNRTERINLDDLEKRTGKLKIDLTGNQLQCTCENKEFIIWLTKTRVKFINIETVFCHGQNGKLINFSDVLSHIKAFERQCISNTWLIISVVGTFFLFVVLIISIIGYRYRFLIEYTFLRVRRWLKKYQPVVGEFEFDVFISYSSVDYDWVINYLYPKLNENFRVCLDAKDFMPGVAIADNILEAIDSSRKVLFIVSKNFLESSWGNYEIEMTRMHAFQNSRDNMVIILLKDDIAVIDMPRCLQSIWWKVVCLKWTDDPVLPAERELLWAKLKDSISN